MLKTRLIVAIVGIPLCLAVVWFGSWVSEIFLILLAIIAFIEYANMMKQKQLRMVWVIGLTMMLNLLLGFYYAWDVQMIGLILFLIMMGIAVVCYPLYTLNELAFSFFGAVYIGFLFGYGICMGYQEQHFLYFILVFFLTWGNDCGGYIFGSLLGKRKLTPQLSPKKTIAGSIGGFILATVAVLVLNFFIPLGFNWGILIILCIIGSMGSQIGDLFASLIKRYFGVKDAGKIIPGHGGILDRFDSFMVVLPIVYYFLLFAA